MFIPIDVCSAVFSAVEKPIGIFRNRNVKGGPGVHFKRTFSTVFKQEHKILFNLNISYNFVSFQTGAQVQGPPAIVISAKTGLSVFSLDMIFPRLKL